MLLGVIADDFTGASDIANTLTKGIPGQGGPRTTQFLGVPKQPALPDVDAGVISLKSRSVAAHEAITQSLEALSWLQAQGCQRFVLVLLNVRFNAEGQYRSRCRSASGSPWRKGRSPAIGRTFIADNLRWRSSSQRIRA